MGDDDNVENEMSIGQPTTSLAAQTLVDGLMDDVWTEEVTTDGSPSPGSASNASDRSKQFVSGILDEIALQDSDSSSSSAEASDQSKEFVSDVLSLEDHGDRGKLIASTSHDFVTGILDEINMESTSDGEAGA